MTDRSDLDDQLFRHTFARCRDQLRQTPRQAGNRRTCESAARPARRRGRVFTTAPEVPPGRAGGGIRSSPTAVQLVVLADEAYRSQYGLQGEKAREIVTAAPSTCATVCRTPRSSASPGHRSRRRTSAPGRCSATTFSVYDIHRAVEDGATVPICYWSRLASSDSTCPGGRRSDLAVRKSPIWRRGRRSVNRASETQMGDGRERWSELGGGSPHCRGLGAALWTGTRRDGQPRRNGSSA
ncbi:MAG: hypothetical protein IPJ61_21130 [Tessaracoccus sp.]|nr:hypothetical protein [Tessaracoccus sp.]